MPKMYQELAKYYDRVYSLKDYQKEVKQLRELIQQHQKSTGIELLEVACGTGKHAEFFKQSYHVVGLDMSRDMLTIARKRNPEVHFILGDMKKIRMKQKFDIITCLFGSINYNTTLTELEKTLQNLAELLKPGGVLVIEPIFTQESFMDRHLSIDSVDDADVKIVRVGLSRKEKDYAILELQYLIATQEGIVHYIDNHRMGLFSKDDILTALRDSGLVGKITSPGLGRESLFIGVKP